MLKVDCDSGPIGSKEELVAVTTRSQSSRPVEYCDSIDSTSSSEQSPEYQFEFDNDEGHSLDFADDMFEGVENEIV